MSSKDREDPKYVDDQPNDEAYKRGNQYKWSKARKADYDQPSTSEDTNKRAYVRTPPIRSL